MKLTDKRSKNIVDKRRPRMVAAAEQLAGEVLHGTRGYREKKKLESVAPPEPRPKKPPHGLTPAQRMDARVRNTYIARNAIVTDMQKKLNSSVNKRQAHGTIDDAKLAISEAKRRLEKLQTARGTEGLRVLSGRSKKLKKREK